MYQKHESEAGRALTVLTVFSIQIFLISNSCNILAFCATTLKFCKITNCGMLFRMITIMFSITVEIRSLLGNALLHRVYTKPELPFVVVIFIRQMWRDLGNYFISTWVVDFWPAKHCSKILKDIVLILFKILQYSLFTMTL